MTQVTTRPRLHLGRSRHEPRRVGELIRKAFGRGPQPEEEGPRVDRGGHEGQRGVPRQPRLGAVQKKEFKEAKKVLQQAVEDKASAAIEIYDHLGDVLMALDETRRGPDGVAHGARARDRQAAATRSGSKLVEEKIQKAGK